MKFYKNNYYPLIEIKRDRLTCIYIERHEISFLKNGKFHNTKNYSYINYISRYEAFYLDGVYCGDENDFTKESWRRFVKLKAFL